MSSPASAPTPDPTATPEQPVRTLIVGCGIIGVHHAVVATRHPAFAVTALVDPVADRAEQVAATVAAEGAPTPAVFDDIAAAVGSGTIDLAVICAPSGLHVDLAEEALAAGVHVVIEKPLDVTVAKSTRFAALAAEAAAQGRTVSVISQHRFDPAAQIVRETIDSGGLGTLTSAVASMAWFRSQGYYDSGDWRGTWALDGGGAVMNQGVHTVDLLRWYLGRPQEVFAHTAQLAHEGLEVEDTATATVRFASGALAVIFCTTAAYPGLTARVQVHGTQGSAIIDNDELKYLHAGSGEVADNLREAKVSGNQAEEALARIGQLVAGEEFAGSRNNVDGFLAGHSRQYDDIAAALAEGRPPSVTVEEALLSQALVRSLYVSATLGQPVLFDDVVAGRYDDVVALVPGAVGGPAAVPAGGSR